MAATIAFAVALFVATNIDQVAVLANAFRDDRFRTRDIVLGALAGNIAIIALGLLGSLLSLVVRHEFLGVLGAVPVCLGITQLIDRDDDDPQPRDGNPIVAVALLALASGADNIGAYIPVFATRASTALAVTIATFLVLVPIWCALCRALVRRPALEPQVRFVATWLTPFVFIALGVLVFVDSGAFALVFP